MRDEGKQWTRRGVMGALGMGVVSLCGCGLHKGDALVEELPYNGLEEVPHGAVGVDMGQIKVPEGPKTAVAMDVGQVVPRSAWTNVGPDLANMRAMGGVKLVTVHHGGDGKPFLAVDATEVAKHIEGVRQWHRQRGMVDIGYHFAIDRAGRVWQLRHMKYEGQHVRIGAGGVRWNEHNAGVVVLGDFTKQTLSAAQGERLVEFTGFLRGHYGLATAAVKMHGELVDTNCPGGSLGAFIKQQRAAGKM
jgi:hypothetical protein